ncbi:MAG: endonuclease/exonuclease/phosphatase family protein [Phocaeicola sp.]
MKNYFSYTLFVTFALLLGLCSCSTAPTLSVMTFNIRYDNPEDGSNAWANRKGHVASCITNYGPDVLGTQEVLHNQLVDLQAALPAYASVGVGRMDGKEAGEYCALFYKKERFDLVKSGTLGLSENPDSIGLIGWDAACERIVTWAILEDKKTKSEIAVFNTHFDHVGSIARNESAKLLLKQIKDIAAELPVVITGDFNVTADSEALQLLEAGGLKNSCKVATKVEGPKWSFHDFGSLPMEDRSLIDFVFVNNSFQVDVCRTVEDKPADTYLTDHLPVWVELTYAK